MWGTVLESIAETFGVTRRTRTGVFAFVVLTSLLFMILSLVEGGPRGLFVVVLLLAFATGAATQILRARATLWRAARSSLEDRAQRPPDGDDDDLAPTAIALYRLARAVNQARRGAFMDAARTLDTVDRDKLRPDEERLFHASRALVALGIGDVPHAAREAERALPTTSEDIDVHLGRALIADAWSSADRLRAIDQSWAEHGVLPGTKNPLPRLRAIVRLRIDTSTIEGIEPWQAKDLADEARAVGDEALAIDLESRVRPAAYR